MAYFVIEASLYEGPEIHEFKTEQDAVSWIESRLVCDRRQELKHYRLLKGFELALKAVESVTRVMVAS